MHAIYDISRPIIFAHRGASRYAPENTVAAFDTALAQGVKAIEMDTMLSCDGIPVVIHDRDLSRTTNGIGWVDQFTAKELKQLDAGSFFLNNYKNERIPFLKEVLIRYRNKMIINIELKNLHAPFDRLAEGVVYIVNELKMTNQVLYSSFNPINLVKIRKLSPRSKIAPLYPAGLVGLLFSCAIFSKISNEFVHLNVIDACAQRVKKEHRRKRRVHVWTVNDPQIAERLSCYRVDGLFTDDPPALISLSLEKRHDSYK